MIRRSGLSLIELLMTIALISILSLVGISALNDSIQEQKFTATQQKFDEIRKAMVGDPRIREGGTKASFGYFGDMNAFPTEAQMSTDFAALTTTPGGVDNYSNDTTYRTGAGWRGPYLTAADQATVDGNDGWGNPILYAYDPGTETATFTSYGADGLVNGTGWDQDLTMSLVASDYRATVRGYVSAKGQPLTGGAEVQLSYPDPVGTGVLTTDTIATEANGYFISTVNAVPFGRRSVKVHLPTVADATSTVGPASFVVDKLDFDVPASLLETQP